MTTGLLIILCLLLSFIFSGIEAGLLSLNRIRLRHRVKRRERAAIRLERLLRNPERLLLTVVLVTNLANILALALTTHWLVEGWGRAGYFLSAAIALPFLLFVLELLPKSLFRRFPYRTLSILSEPVRWAILLLNPLLKLAIRVAHQMVPPDEARSGKLFAAREDFKYFTIESERSGTLSPEERQTIQHVIDFRTIRARDVLVPLSRLPMISAESSVDEMIAISRGGSLDAMLVTAPGEGGKVLGLVYLLEALLDRHADSKVGAFIRPLGKVAPDEMAPRLLWRLRASRTPILLVEEAERPIGLIFREALYQRMIVPGNEAA